MCGNSAQRAHRCLRTSSRWPTQGLCCLFSILAAVLSSGNAPVTFVSWNSWLARWQDDLFKSTFYLFHFVWRARVFDCVCVSACECLCAHGTSKVSGVKEHLLLFLPRGQRFTVRLTTFSVEHTRIHSADDSTSWPHSASWVLHNPSAPASVMHLCSLIMCTLLSVNNYAWSWPA